MKKIEQIHDEFLEYAKNVCSRETIGSYISNRESFLFYGHQVLIDDNEYYSSVLFMRTKLGKESIRIAFNSDNIPMLIDVLTTIEPALVFEGLEQGDAVAFLNK